MYKKSKLAKSIRLVIAFGAASATAFTATTATAQSEEESVEKIAVTGSRIRKVDFVSNAPVATIGADQFELTATVNTEQLLNTLPQVVPGLDRTSNNPGNGTATVDLRGLGTNRTLVLINGTRAVPTTRSGTVDINSIPTSLIRDVEVLTGGASAVYGSDAVAGVVNFILKDDFEGVEASAGYETTEEGDATVYNADLTIGGNFADDRGNVVFNMSYTDREELFQGDRSFSTFAQFEDGEGGLFDGGSSGIPGTAIFNGGLGDYSPSTGITFDSNGAIRPFITSGDNNDYYNYAPVNYIQLPQERHQITALGEYEISDQAEVYGRALFTDSRVPQQLAATPIFQIATFTLDGNPFLTRDSQTVLSDGIGDGIDTDGDGVDDTASALVRRRLLEVGERRSLDSFQSFQAQLGIRGAVGESNWLYDAYYQTGKVQNSSAQLGNINRDRFNQALLLATDENGNVVLDANGNPSCADSSANGSTVACAPMNIFGEGNISEDAAAYLRTAVASQALFDQKLFGISLSGDTEGWFELPGGSVGIALGYENRDESFEFLPSQDLAAGTIAGFNGAPAINGGVDVSEYYAELYLPILDGAPMAEILDVELAFRAADYSTAGDVESYKIAGSWAPIEEVRFRAGFNTAVRAPNIGELFSPQGESFPGASDPCSASGANDTSQRVRDLCLATGVPSNVVFSNAIDPASGQVRSLVGGNPDLKEEEAETLTLGVVVTPMEDLSISLDYFDIEIEDAVGRTGTNNILDLCYNNTVDGGAGSIFCNAVKRRSDGTIEYVSDGVLNAASLTLTGVDLIASYQFDVFDGSLAVDYIGTYTKESDYEAYPDADLIECAGRFGKDCGEPTPEYKHRTTLKYTADDWKVQLSWRFVGEVDDDDDATTYAVEKIGAKSYLDFSGSYSIADNYTITGGVDNLLDKSPPILGENQEQANTYPATYDVFGRTYFVSVKAKF